MKTITLDYELYVKEQKELEEKAHEHGMWIAAEYIKTKIRKARISACFYDWIDEALAKEKSNE